MNEKIETPSLKDIYDKYANSIYRICMRYTKNSEEAQDLTHEVFLRLHQNLNQFEGRSALFTWIFRIATNVCLDHLRKNQRYTKKTDLLKNHLLLENQAASEREIAPEILENILKEPEGETREVVFAHYMQGLTHQEIADSMGVSRVAITRRLIRFVESMKKKYHKLSDEELLENN